MAVWPPVPKSSVCLGAWFHSAQGQSVRAGHPTKPISKTSRNACEPFPPRPYSPNRNDCITL
eukprot:5026701-Amphidinium_carterae.1